MNASLDQELTTTWSSPGHGAKVSVSGRSSGHGAKTLLPIMSASHSCFCALSWTEETRLQTRAPRPLGPDASSGCVELGWGLCLHRRVLSSVCGLDPPELSPPAGSDNPKCLQTQLHGPRLGELPSFQKDKDQRAAPMAPPCSELEGPSSFSTVGSKEASAAGQEPEPEPRRGCDPGHGPAPESSGTPALLRVLLGRGGCPVLWQSCPGSTMIL